VGVDGGVHAPILLRGVARQLLRSNPSHLLVWAIQVVYLAALHSRTALDGGEEVVAAACPGHTREEDCHTAMEQVPKADAVCDQVRLMGTPDWVVGIWVVRVGAACVRLDHQGM
jgi:hypothetical protein